MLNTSSVGKMKVLRILRLLRLVKLLRILRAARIFARLETQYNIDYSALELAKFGVLALVTSHWMACAWGLVADLEDSDYNWLKYTAFNTFHETGKLEIGQDPVGVVSTTDIYIAAFYWSSMTMTTIGYGDIVPITTTERVYAIVCMFIGATSFGYIIGSIAASGDEGQVLSTSLKPVYAFCDKHNLSMHIRQKLKKHMQFYVSQRSPFDEFRKFCIGFPFPLVSLQSRLRSS